MRMDCSSVTQILASVLLFIVQVSALLGLPQPEDLKVKVLDGEVVAHWQRPAAAPSNVLYNVEISKYANEWTMLPSCTETTHTLCDLTAFIHNYQSKYRVRVQTVVHRLKSNWTARSFLPNKSELQPPSFTLCATSSTITVSIHDKPILKKLFPYGLDYTIHLEERAQEIKNTTGYLKGEVWETGKTKVFRSLHWGVEYCVSIKVEGSGALYSSNMSPRQCLQLPEQEWFIISVSSLSVVGVLGSVGVMVIGLLCYLKRPAKTPAALKSPKPGWHPLDVGEGVMEVVTDKGWFLFGPETQSTVIHTMETEADNSKEEEGDTEEEVRRTSMDSGVCMRSNPGTAKQDDSGFGSMGAPEGSDSGQTVYPLPDHSSAQGKGEDSVWGGGALTDCGGGGSYRSQKPPACQVEEVLERTEVVSALAEVVSGYRAAAQACICAGTGRCTWCHQHGLLQPPAKGGELLQALTGKVTAVGEEATLIEFGESFPLLTSLTDTGKDINMNNVSLSLCDIQLQSD